MLTGGSFCFASENHQGEQALIEVVNFVRGFLVEIFFVVTEVFEPVFLSRIDAGEIGLAPRLVVAWAVLVFLFAVEVEDRRFPGCKAGFKAASEIP